MIEGLKPYAEYKESGQDWLGNIPAHWDVRRTKLLLREVDSRSSTGKEQLLRVSQYTGVTQRKAADGSDAPDTRAASLVGYKRVAANDLVINIMLAWNGSLGASRYDGIASPAYCVYRFGKNALPWYCHEMFRLPLYKGRIKTASTGVVESRLRLYSDDLGRVEALLPPPDEQAATRSYDFLATILPYGVQEWEKLSIFLNFLISKLPAPKEEDLAKGILDAIDMDSYRAEKKAMIAIALPDADAEIEPAPTGGGARKPEPELDKLSNIVKQFNDQFGGLFLDSKAVEKRITEVIPPKVAADPAYQNAKKNTPSTARIEHDKALKRVITAMFKDDAQLFKQFQDNDSFRGWLTATVFGLTSGES